MLVRGFIKLLKRYREGTLPEGKREVMDQWYQSVQYDPVESCHREEIGERIWEGIVEHKDRVQAPQGRGVDLYRHSRRVFRAAAVVLILLSAGLYLRNQEKPGEATIAESVSGQGEGWVETVNNGSGEREVVLPDGSSVRLAPGSRLRSPEQFEAASRTVYLEGDGFFDVVRDAQRPFLVYADAVVTRVLGTSFSVKTVAGDKGIEVSVVTGKVLVEKAAGKKETGDISKEQSSVLLTPNKKVTFFKDSDHFVTGLVEDPVLVSDNAVFLKPDAFIFDEAPLGAVLEKLKEAYGVDIIVSDDTMLECPVTADLTSENLYGKVEIIGEVLNAQYKVTSGSILLSGGRCHY